MKALKVTIAALLLLLLAAAIYLTLPAIRAHRLLSQVKALQIGTSTYTEAQSLATSIAATPDNSCSSTDCTWSRRIDNLALPQSWIGEGATFSAGFRVQNGIVTERGIALQLGSGAVSSPFADAEERVHWNGAAPPSPVTVQTQWSAHVPHYSVFIFMVPAVPAETRSKYLDFNLNCLWKYGGCQSASELLPTVEWKDK